MSLPTAILTISLAASSIIGRTSSGTPVAFESPSATTVAPTARASGGGRDDSKNDAPSLLAPDAPTSDEGPRSTARARVDAARYAAAPPDARDRRGPIWLAIVATLTLALAALAPRRPAALVAAVAVAWSIGLLVGIARRPAFDRVVDRDVDWLIARRAGTASVPIADDVAWVPVVESMRHWQALSPRVVDDSGRASLALTLTAPGARVALARTGDHAR